MTNASGASLIGSTSLEALVEDQRKMREGLSWLRNYFTLCKEQQKAAGSVSEDLGECMIAAIEVCSTCKRRLYKKLDGDCSGFKNKKEI